jgi:outer membrane lipoprotein-sorting protein
MRRRAWCAFSSLLVLGLILAACGRAITAEEIVAKVRETVESTVDAHGVVSVDINAQGVEVAITAEVWEKSPNKLRFEVIEASRADLVGMLLVSDGERAMSYNPERNVAMISPVGEVEMPLPQQMLTELQGVVQDLLDASDAELAGEETIAGHETYKLILAPKEEDGEGLFPGGGTATVWVDRERWIVLKATYEGSTFGQGEVEVRSFELNPGLPDDLFRFDVPEGAEVVDAEAQRPEYLSLDEAETQAEFPLLVPDYVPEDATLVEVSKLNGSFVLLYDHSPDVSFTVVQGAESANPLLLADSLVGSWPAEEISVRDQSATLISDDVGGNTLLYWTENGVTITVAGHISLEEALKVAESLR